MPKKQAKIIIIFSTNLQNFADVCMYAGGGGVSVGGTSGHPPYQCL